VLDRVLQRVELVLHAGGLPQALGPRRHLVQRVKREEPTACGELPLRSARPTTLGQPAACGVTKRLAQRSQRLVQRPAPIRVVRV